jgi:hypothetical protein
MKLLLVMLLLFPGVALASGECCFVGPGDCFVIRSVSEMNTCEVTPNSVALESPCTESPECMLSEEPASQPPERISGLLRRDAMTKEPIVKADASLHP